MSAIPIDEEKLLLLQVASDDEEAFALIYHQYYAIVKRFVAKFVKSHPLSDDIVQEVFIKIWEHRSRLAAIHSFKAYLLIVTRNHTLSLLKQMAQDEAATNNLIKQYQQFRNPAEEKLVSKEYRQCLQKILPMLPAQTRTVFNLCREQDKNYYEAAQILGISRNAVKKHMVRANKVFKSSCKQLFDISIKLLALFIFLK